MELAADRTLRILLQGRWSLSEPLPSTRAIEDGLASAPPPRAVTFDTARLVAWDSAALLVLERIGGLCRRHGVPLDLAGLPEGAHRLLALAEAVPEKRDARPPGTKPPWIARVGQGARTTWHGAAESTTFLGEMTLAFARLLRRRATFRLRDLALI